MNKPKLSIGRHLQGNRMPSLLWRYGWPKPLLTDYSSKEAGYQQYKWLWWYIVVPNRER